MDTNFFQITEKLLNDKESLELKIQKVGDQLAVLVMPKIKAKKAIVTINGTAQELDEHFFNELQKPIEKINGLQSNADTAPIEDDEEAETAEEKVNTPVKKITQPEKNKRGRKSKTETNNNQAQPEEQESETKPEQETNTAAEVELAEQQAKEEAEIAEKAHLEAEAEENARREKEELEATFTHYIESGDRAFNKHKYKQALDYYTKAEQLKPNNKEAGKKIELAAKWVKVLNENGLLNEEEEKEVSDGVENN